MKTRILISAVALFLVLVTSVNAQSDKNIRQKNLQKRENVNTTRQENIEKRNPNGYGRVDNRVDRRGDRINRKQTRTDRRVNRRKGN
jgi:Ni/Co efflux regulator RcnB